jgi:hypothetical protein
MVARQSLEIQYTTDLVASIPIVTGIQTLMQTGLQQLIAMALTHSRTTLHNGVMRTTMGLEAILKATILTIVQIKQGLPIKINSVVLTEMVTDGRIQETHSLTTVRNGPMQMETTTETINLETILTHSQMMPLNGVTKTVMATETILVEPTETDSQATHCNGLTSIMMAMVTISSMLMKMGFRKETLTYALKPMVNLQMQPLEDVLTPMVTDTPTHSMHSLISLYNGQILTEMVMETTHNSQTVTSALMSLARVYTMAGRDVLIQISTDTATLMATGLQSPIVLAQMPSRTILSNGVTKTGMVLETIMS